MADDTDSLFEEYEQERQQRERVRMTGAATLTMGTDPDAAARAHNAATYLGIPPQAALAAPADTERAARLKKLDADTAGAPVLRRKYTDADFARLASDDSGVLAGVEGVVGKLGRAAVDVGKYVVSAPGALEGGLLADVGRAGRAIASGAPTLGAGMYGVAAAPFELLGMDTIGGFLRGESTRAKGEAERWMGQDPNAGFVQKSVMSGLQSAGSNLLTMPFGLARGGTNAMLGIMGAVTGGQTYTKAREAGLSPARAIPYAVEDATAEIITERFFGAAGFLQQIKAGASAGKLFMYELAKELPGEMGATLWQNFNEWTNVKQDKSVADFLNEQPEALVQTAIATMVGGTTQIGAVKAIQGVMGQFDGQQQQAERANTVAQDVEQFIKLMEASKLRGRHSQTFVDMVNEMAEERGGETPSELYVDSQQLANSLNQSGFTIDELRAIAPEMARQLENPAPGSDVRAPVGELAALGPELTTALVDHVRETPSAMSRAEAQEFLTSEPVQTMREQFDRTMTTREEQQTLRQQVAEVSAGFEQQLNATGRFSPQVAKAQSSLLGNFYAVQAMRAGVPLQEFMQKYRLNVAAQTPVAGQQGQMVSQRQQMQAHIATPEFKAWFGESKVVDEQGAPMVVYHGTDADFDEFKADGEPIFLTQRPWRADVYSDQEGGNVMPLFASVKNPATYKQYEAARRANRGPDARKKAVAALRAQGYDGVIDDITVMVFDPEQIKSATGNRGTFDPTDANVLHQAAKTTFKTGPQLFPEVVEGLELTPEEINSTVMEFMTGLPGDMAFFPPLVGGIPEVVAFLSERRAASGLPTLDIKKPEDRTQVARLMAAEALAHIRNAGDSLAWYDETINATIAQMAIKYPELNTDPHARNMFLVATAIASQGMNPEANLAYAEEQYAAFRKTGRFPEVGRGEAAPAMAGRYAIANKLLDEMGPVLFRRFLQTPFTVRELKTAGFDVGGESMDELVLGSSVLGPKIGFGFYSNLSGNFEPVTMDMWFMRTVGRLTGKLAAFKPEKFAEQLSRFREGLKVRGKASEGIFSSQFDKDLVKRAKTDEDAAMELARKVKSAHEKDFKTHRADYDAGKRAKSEMVAAADTMIISMDKPRDVPASGGERQLLRDIVRQMVDLVTQQYGTRIPPAALQALIWYPEQELYSALGVKLAVTSQDYAGSARKLLLKDGISEESLDAAVAASRRGSGSARPDDGGQVPAGDRPDGQGAGRAGPLTGDERTRFIAERAARVAAGTAANVLEQGAVGGLRSQQAGDGSGRPPGGNAAPGQVPAPERATAPLDGAPRVEGATGPDPRIVAVAEQYARENGIPLARQASYAKVDPALAARIADAYEAMPHAPQDPAVREAYENLVRQTVAQYQALAAAGYKFWFIDGSTPAGAAYTSSPFNAMRDIRANQSMGVFPTQEGFGNAPPTADNVMLTDTGILWPYGGPDGPLKPVLANDLFRAVHDAFGHGMEGAGFREQGEENAWQAHVRLFTGSAVGAITSETRGQNSWLNFGPHGEANRTAKVEDTVFADQKTGLMPEWTWSEGRVPDAPGVLEQGQPGKDAPPRGSLHFGADITASPSVMALLADADKSTFFHESGHFFLEVQSDLAARIQGQIAAGTQVSDSERQIVDDMNRILNWFGIEGDSQTSALDRWLGMTLAEKEASHEMWARGFERFIGEGKAPNLDLQPLFARFRAWLVDTYKTLVNLNVKLTDDVRMVMSRMIASDAAIAETQAARAMGPLFRTAEQAGMTGEEYADYQRLAENATAAASAELDSRLLADMKWLSKARDKAMKAAQATADTQRKEVRREVSVEVMARPVYQAWQILTGKGDLALPGVPGTEMAGASLRLRSSKVKEIDAEAYEILAKRRMTSEDRGWHPDIAAENIPGGAFASGEQLVREVAAAPPPAQVIDALTDQRMLERYGDITSPAALARAADEAVHNELRARVIASELRALAKAGRIRESGDSLVKSRDQIDVMARAAREYAQEIIGRQQIRHLRPEQYAAAEARSAKLAEKAMGADTAEAAMHKRNQLVNNYATKAAYEAQTEVTKATEFFRRVLRGNKDDISKVRDWDLVQAARAVLAAYDIGSKGEAAQTYLETLQRNDPVAYQVIKDQVDDLTANARPVREMTVEDFRVLAEAVRELWYKAKRDRQIEVDGQLVSIETAKLALSQRLDDIGVPQRVPGEGQAVTDAERRLGRLRTFRASMRRVEGWVTVKDGGYTGPFRKYIWNPIKEASERLRADNAKYLTQYQALLANLVLTEQRIEAPELGYVFGAGRGGLGKAELLHAMLHTGNQSNLRKLLLGGIHRSKNRSVAWAVERPDGTLDTTKWDGFVKRMIDTGVLTKEDFDFMQGVWDMLEEIKPLAQKTHREVFGRYFDEVTADAFTNQLGTWRGGYVPAMTDPEIVKDQQTRQMAETQQQSLSNAFPTTAKGFTKARVEYNQPLLLDLRSLSSHINKVLMFAHMEQPVREVRKILASQEVSTPLHRMDASTFVTMLEPWLNRAARQQVETPIPGDNNLMRAFSILTQRAGMAAMFANVSNTAQQITGFSLAALRVSPINALRAAVDYVKAPRQFTRAVTDNSSYMSMRMTNEVHAMNGAIDDILLNPSTYATAQAWTAKHAYFMQSAFDNVMGPIIWTAAYNQGVEKHGMDDREAKRFADSTIRQTQGSSLPEDISAIESGNALVRSLMQFAGYFNMQANLIGTEFAVTMNEVGLRKGMGRGVYIFIMGFYIPAVVAELIAVAFRGGPGDEDKDGSVLDDWLSAVLLLAPLKTTLAMIPGVGKIGNMLINMMNENPSDDRMSISPAVSMIESAAKAGHDVYKAVKDDGNRRNAVRDVATLISLTTGLPATAVARPLGYLAGVEQGKVTPTGPVDATRGMVTGTPSPESRR